MTGRLRRLIADQRFPCLPGDLLLFAGAALLATGNRAEAQMSPPGFAGFKHIHWGADQGAPNGIHEIAQTPDGYIWLTGDGLYRFDGTAFERIDWPAGVPWKRLDPISLMVSRSGELWIGLNARPALVVYRGGQLVSAGMPHPPGPITAMAQGPDGTMWFAAGRPGSPLLRLTKGRWDRLPLPAGFVMDLRATGDGSLWVALTGEDGHSGMIARLAKGASQFALLPDHVSALPRLGLAPDGALWVSDQAGTRMLVDAQGARPPHPVRVPLFPSSRRATFAFDQQGGLWRTSAANGITYVPNVLARDDARTMPVHRFTAANGLTSDFTYQTMVDREGSVWVTSEAGLDQFRRARATQEALIPAEPVNGLAIAAASDGSVYIQSGEKLFDIAPGAAPHQLSPVGPAAVAMCAARQGGVWIVQPGQLRRVDGSHVERLRSYAGAATPINCAQDREGRLWVSLSGAPVVWRDEAGWHTATSGQQAWEMMATRSGDIAFNGLPRLGTLRGNQLAFHGRFGTATMLTTSGDDIYLSDAQGLVRLRGHDLRRLDDKRFPWLIWLRGLVRTRRGETWLMSRSGLYLVSSADLDHAFADRHAPLPYRYFDTQDGLASTAQHAGFKGRQIVEGGDGRVWFLNRLGAAYLAPDGLRPNPLAPPVAIRALASGNTVWRDPAHLVLPAGTRALDITYAGLSFVTPRRMRFAYRLEGVDADWIDAGARRLASYTNLGPGTYRFKVIAANADGRWNMTGAGLIVEIRPTFMQTNTFRLLCGVALAGLLWGAYALRLRMVAARIRQRMNERYEERDRIARELHDTLLQGIQSLTLRFQRVVNELPDQPCARVSLLHALDVADQVIAEGRDRVQDLRSRQHDMLGALLRDMIAQLPFEPGLQINIAENGRPRRIEPLALDEMAGLFREALTNICRHAGASRIEIAIDYGWRLVVRVVDDGVGINPDIAVTGKAGHFGVPGMHERACRLRARLVLRPLPGHGTELVLTVPADVAYWPERRGFLTPFRRVA
ncbi:MAG: hypothetical protein KGH96_04090 [Sphingomonadales bacterium]|nr:hypothetical protein [Sphingomonadales bacterium]